MSRNSDPLARSPHWHIDCRIEAELPEDNIVGTRFLINVVLGSIALAMLLFTGWLGYTCLSLRYQVRDWEQRISDNRAEVADITRMQREYAVESAKIDQAWQLIKPQFIVSGFIANLGRTRPEQMVFDTIEWNEAGVAVRGSLRETSARAAGLLSDYVKLLARDEKIGPLFDRDRIRLTNVDRGTGDNVITVITYEISFPFRPAKP